MREYRNILITGGAGFVGSSLGIAIKHELENTTITALDNLRRRGSELNLARLRSYGVQFQHGDIRNREDLKEIGPFDLLIDCSAEASVHAGYQSEPAYVVNTNLSGTVNCLERARRFDSDVVFLSTSRVYPIARLQALPLEVSGKRLAVPISASGLGWSAAGISTEFPLDGFRSLYGATKLASELLLLEYAEMYNLRMIIDRCGVLSGPWQMGRVDQGFVSLWAAIHKFGGQLTYQGFGGLGHQVRDVLHVADLYTLLKKQLDNFETARNNIYNVGGGPDVSTSLAELSDLCAQYTTHSLQIQATPKTTKADIPYYVTDNSIVSREFGWKPHHDMNTILDEIFRWLTDHRDALKPIFNKNDV